MASLEMLSLVAPLELVLLFGPVSGPLSCSVDEEASELARWGLMETGDTSADDSTRAATAAA